ncbi:MAG: NAD(P)-dependent oxidoreductase [Calditrichaeota bacterium]|nr:MAG: NAD(P)-dependent oxidoreductase [Calditrichota bacterium]MBL1206888.1 NAD(P)-dependent oxidoreductase [Calditrichota bacterium]NOG46714.1 NAD(P)-dependent oxidoreductase [Calditrichota bacterium]
MAGLKNKTIIITGASRGIGKAMAIKFAKNGANIVAASKSLTAHPKLPGSLEETVADVKKSGGQAIAVQVDVRHPDQVNNMVESAVETFGGVDMLVNNAGAISLTSVEKTSLKLYDRMHYVNDRAVFLCSQAVLPYLKNSDQGHILTLSPPINLNPKWLKDYSPYTASKYSMSMLTIGMAEELKEDKIAVNSLWPKTIIATAAIEFAVGDKNMLNVCRTTDIMADAAFEIISTNDMSLTGNLFIDEDILREKGVQDFDKYLNNPEFKGKLYPDLFLDE